jgi:integrase/recombinase XerC
MPDFVPKTRARAGKTLTQDLAGELARYAQGGLYERSVSPRSIYRYRGVLLQYQKALGGQPPSLEASRLFLGRLRGSGFHPATLHLYRAVLQGFHAWRSERLVFAVKVPHHLPPYHSIDKVNQILSLSTGNLCDNLILRLMSDAGLRRDEVVGLRVRNVDLASGMLRTRGKGDIDRDGR